MTMDKKAIVPPGVKGGGTLTSGVLHLSQLNHDELDFLATRKCQEAFSSANWHASIHLPLHPFCNNDELASISEEPKNIDLCSFFNGQNGFVTKLYLGRKMYSPIMDEDSDDNKKDKLAAVDALIKSRAKDAGSVVVIGHSSVGRQVKRFYSYRDYVCGFCNTNNTCCGGNAAQEKETIPDDKNKGTLILIIMPRGLVEGKAVGEVAQGRSVVLAYPESCFSSNIGAMIKMSTVLKSSQ
mmetsp:Transcript_867/g.1392  ORF Transcript_867/g.1392 Transcript_867/m.1392 type:complete len:239 (+) Transcript_867:1511-2227(+)